MPITQIEILDIQKRSTVYANLPLDFSYSGNYIIINTNNTLIPLDLAGISRINITESE